MKFSDATSLVAVLISLIAVSLPLWRSRQQSSIKEAIAVPTFKHATWIYVIVANDSTSPLMIHGATLAGLRVYRHKHWFADRGMEGKQFSTEFPLTISPNSEYGILMEFVDRENNPIARDKEIDLILNSNKAPITYQLTIDQCSVDIETALREI